MRVQKRFYVALDIKRPTANRDFEVVEGDNGNVLDIELTDEGTAVDLTDSLILAIFSKSDGHTAQQDTNGNGITADGNLLTISLYTGSVAPGLVECELQVYSGEDHTTLITSAKFNFMCRRGIANDDTIPATTEWPLLVDALERVQSVEGDLLTLIDTTAGELADLNEQTTTAAELANTATDAANTAASNATTATSAANTAAGAANDATSAANAAANAANVAAGQAISAAGYAQDQGDYAKAMGEATEDILNSGITWDTLPGKPSEFQPTAHTHGAIGNDGKIGTTADLPVFTGEGGALETRTAAEARAALGVNSTPLHFFDIYVAASEWEPDDTYADYAYRVSITLAGVRDTMVPDVVFETIEATSGNLSPVAVSYDGGVYLFAKEVPNDITIPTITLWGGM